MLDTWILAAVAVVLLVAVGALVIAYRRRGSRHREELEREREAGARSLATVEQTFSERLDQERRHAEDAQALVERMRAFTARALQWDTASRDLIVHVARETGVDGCLASNVLFVVRERSGRPFVAQVDHVLLTSRTAAVVEGKFWTGAVFDGVRPSAVHPAFAALVDEGQLGEEFALQLKRGDSQVSVMVKSGGDAPRAQARRQAARLSGMVEQRTGLTQWFEPYVLYAHPDVSLFAGGRAGAGTGRTPVLQGAQGVRALLDRAVAAPEETPVDVVRIGDALAELGADVVGLGSHAGRWVSPLG